MGEPGATTQRPVTAVLWDDGALTRAGCARVAVLVDEVVLAGFAHPAPVLAALGNDVRARVSPVVVRDLGDALALARDVGASLLAVGTPFDAAEWAAKLLSSWRAAPAPLVVHVVHSGPSRRAVVMGVEAAGRSWAGPLQRALARQRGPGSEVTVAAAGASIAEVVSRAAGDVFVVLSARPHPEPADVVPREPVRVAASDVVHAILTDVGLEVTNRTGFAVDVRVRLGVVSDPDDDVVTVQVALEPAAARTFTDDELGALAAVPAPQPVLRQWSHEAEVVYEGGQRRINGVDVRFHDPGGGPPAVVSHGSHRGLVVGITSRDIARAIDASLTVVAGSYARADGAESVPEILARLRAADPSGPDAAT